jgi:hypothetical protein
MKELSITFGKGVVYALCFWFVYKGMNFVSQSLMPRAAQAEQTMSAENYVLQQERTNRLLDESEKQHKRMSAVITQQEENANRFKLLLDQAETKGKK